jgi:hypothetical protein
MDIDKLEGIELDRLVAEKVMGLRSCGLWRHENLGSAGGPVMMHDGNPHPEYRCYPDTPRQPHMNGYLGGPPAYSEQIALAWKVVEKLVELDKFSALCCGRYSPEKKRWTSWICEVDIAGEGNFEADTAPLAICRAALATV